eukprot:1157950-Pelagomonas_calceolata.AAC.7
MGGRRDRCPEASSAKKKLKTSQAGENLPMSIQAKETNWRKRALTPLHHLRKQWHEKSRNSMLAIRLHALRKGPVSPSPGPQQSPPRRPQGSNPLKPKNSGP